MQKVLRPVPPLVHTNWSTLIYLENSHNIYEIPGFSPQQTANSYSEQRNTLKYSGTYHQSPLYPSSKRCNSNFFSFFYFFILVLTKFVVVYNYLEEVYELFKLIFSFLFRFLLQKISILVLSKRLTKNLITIYW